MRRLSLRNGCRTIALSVACCKSVGILRQCIHFQVKNGASTSIGLFEEFLGHWSGVGFEAFVSINRERDGVAEAGVVEEREGDVVACGVVIGIAAGLVEKRVVGCAGEGGGVLRDAIDIESEGMADFTPCGGRDIEVEVTLCGPSGCDMQEVRGLIFIEGGLRAEHLADGEGVERYLPVVIHISAIAAQGGVGHVAVLRVVGDVVGIPRVRDELRGESVLVEDDFRKFRDEVGIVVIIIRAGGKHEQ